MTVELRFALTTASIRRNTPITTDAARFKSIPKKKVIKKYSLLKWKGLDTSRRQWQFIMSNTFHLTEDQMFTDCFTDHIDSSMVGLMIYISYNLSKYLRKSIIYTSEFSKRQFNKRS